MAAQLPLFPLSTVLYPGLLLPLHIFEERYRTLVRDLTAASTEPSAGPPESGSADTEQELPAFGVVAIRQGHEVGADGVRELHEVGCTAEIRRIEALPDGRFDLVTSGARRFRLTGVDDSAPYLMGEVEFLDEPAGADAEELAPSVAAHYHAYREQLLTTQGQAPRVRGPLPSDPLLLSYLVAAAMVLDRADKQRLLEAPDAANRLAEELALLRRERAMLAHLPSLPGAEIRDQPGSHN